MLFPHTDPFPFEDELVTRAWVENELEPMLPAERLEKIERVISGRTYSVTVVLEDIYDRGNSSAVIRSAEAMGYQSVHHIEPNERFKVSNRVSKGADKWLDHFHHSNTGSAISDLKSRGYKIVATSLGPGAIPIQEVSLDKPIALVFGNEKEGISAEMQEKADVQVVLPMSGFVESFNISVAAALCLYSLCQRKIEKTGSQGDLTEEQLRLLRAVYICRSNPERTRKLLKCQRSRQ